MDTLKAVIFDFDGVVADSEPVHRKSFNLTLKKLGIFIPNKLYREKYVGLGSLSIMEDIFRTYGIKRSAKFWVRKRMRVFQELVKKEGVKPVKGFMKFNKLLNKLGVKKIIASGGYRKNIATMLKKLKLYDEFKNFIGREDVKNRKPDPEALLLAAKKLGVKPSECLVFEDSPYGVEAARRAGMKCVALTTSLPRSYFPYCKTIKDFREVDLNLLRKMGYK
ncbi:MAG: HAD family phosphatase [Candidatus Micrarchaeia archaeon]